MSGGEEKQLLSEAIARAANGYGGIRNGLYGEEAALLADAVLASPWLVGHDQRVRAKALADAADEWQRGNWADVTPPPGMWLRARANAPAHPVAEGNG